MKKLLTVILLVLVAFSFAQAQKPWVEGNIVGVKAFMTGKVSLALADTATCDTTKGTSAINSATLSGAAINRKNILVGWQVVDTAIAGTTTTNPTARIDVQASFNGTYWFPVKDSAVTSKAFNSKAATGIRGGGFLTEVDATSWQYPYYRLVLTPTNGTLGTQSTGITSAIWKVGRFRFVVVPKF